MLSSILAIYEQDPGALCLEEVALVKLGKLVEIDTETCGLCAARSMCILISSGRRSFTLASRVTPADIKAV